MPALESSVGEDIIRTRERVGERYPVLYTRPRALVLELLPPSPLARATIPVYRLNGDGRLSICNSRYIR